MNKTKIEWTDYTWNPVTGCFHDCFYCYAKRIAMRFDGHFEPTFHQYRLDEPMKLKKPSKIFVCSMADLFGHWVEIGWINLVMAYVKNSPQHIFQFLTKNPQRYLEFEFPENVELGVTIDGSEDREIAKRKVDDLIIAGYKNKLKTFISFEPLLGDVSYLIIERIDKIIIGQMTGQGAIKAKREWVEGIKHRNIFIKSNLRNA